MGDQSDNIPGVPGIGEKTALKIIAEYGDVENAIANADKLPKRAGESLLANADLARFSYKLAKINTAVPLNFDIESARIEYMFTDAAKKELARLGLKKFNARFEDVQTSLF